MSWEKSDIYKGEGARLSQPACLSHRLDRGHSSFKSGRQGLAGFLRPGFASYMLCDLGDVPFPLWSQFII